MIDSLSIAITSIDCVLQPSHSLSPSTFSLTSMYDGRVNHLERLGVAHQLGNSRPSSLVPLNNVCTERLPYWIGLGIAHLPVVSDMLDA